MFKNPSAMLTLMHTALASASSSLPNPKHTESSVIYQPSQYPEWIVPVDSLLPMTVLAGDPDQQPMGDSSPTSATPWAASKTVFRLPAIMVMAWTETLLCSTGGCKDMPASVHDSRALPTISATKTIPVCQKSADYTATITPPAVIDSHSYWASELAFSKTLGLKYCKSYPGTISRCMARYTKSYSVRYNITSTEIESEVEIKMYPGHTITETEIETEVEVETTIAKVKGPHWGIVTPTALGQQPTNGSCSDEASCIVACQHERAASIRALVILSSVFGGLMLLGLLGMLAKQLGKKKEERKEVARNTPRVPSTS